MVSSFEFSNHVVGIMIDKNLTREYMDEIHKLILEKIKEFDQISLFCEVQSGSNLPVKLMMKELKFKYQNSINIKKLAVVSDITWLRTVMDINDVFISTDIQTFEIEDRLVAMDWITQH